MLEPLLRHRRREGKLVLRGPLGAGKRGVDPHPVVGQLHDAELLGERGPGGEVVDPDAREGVLGAPQIVVGKDQVERCGGAELSGGDIDDAGRARGRQRGRRLAEREPSLIDAADGDDQGAALGLEVALVEIELPERLPQRQLDPVLVLDLLPANLLVVEDRLAEVVALGEPGERGIELDTGRHRAGRRLELRRIVADGVQAAIDDDVEPGKE